MLHPVDRLQRMPGTGNRMAGRLDDAVDALERAQVGRALGDKGLAGVHRVGKRRGVVFLGLPASALQ